MFELCEQMLFWAIFWWERGCDGVHRGVCSVPGEGVDKSGAHGHELALN